jgi:hypothetical protein
VCSLKQRSRYAHLEIYHRYCNQCNDWCGGSFVHCFNFCSRSPFLAINHRELVMSGFRFELIHTSTPTFTTMGSIGTVL